VLNNTSDSSLTQGLPIMFSLRGASRNRDSKVIRVEIVEHYPPDTTACIFWLKNRQPGRWRDRVDVQHEDGRIGVIGRMPTDEEWAERYGGGGEPVLVVDNSP
jgi:hypothetical protein